MCVCVEKRERDSNGVVWKAHEEVEKKTVNGNTGIFLKYFDGSLLLVSFSYFLLFVPTL